METEALRHASLGELPEHSKLGPYRLVQQLGEGGMGVVHLALDPHGKAVAIKVLRPHIAHDPGARARLAREVATLERIRVPGVAPVLDADIEGERPYLVTRFVPGPSLDDVVRAHGPVQGQRLHRLAYGLTDALHAIHDADVIHRDLKPGNVLMLDDDPVLIDFGIAHVADDVRITMTGLVMGTPGYLSPEVVEGAPVTEATDWWGWAATLGFAASGRPPFGRGPMDVVLARVSRGEADLSGVDPALAPLLYAALSPRPHERPEAAEVVAALERYAAGEPATQVLSQPSPPTRHTQVMEQTPTGVLPPVDPLPEADPWPWPPLSEGVVASPAPEGLQPHYPSPGQPAYGPGATAWEPQPDSRIGRPNRSGTLAALLVLLVAAVANWPVVAAAALLLWMVLARTADRSVTALVLRRHTRGRRRSDVPVAVLAGPWHLLVAVVGSLVAALLPALVGLSAWVCASLGLAAVLGGSPRPTTSAALAVGGLAAILLAWWGPAGASLRRGTRSLVRGVTGHPVPRSALVAAALLAAAGCAGWAYLRHGQPLWWPTGAPPQPWSTGG